MPWLPIEVKLNNDQLSQNWTIFLKQLQCECGIQIIKSNGIFKIQEKLFGKILTISAAHFLSYLI
jgi:hypothetical protein